MNVARHLLVVLLVPDKEGGWVLVRPLLAAVALLWGLPGLVREWRATRSA